jgi:hypothetical protein
MLSITDYHLQSAGKIVPAKLLGLGKSEVATKTKKQLERLVSHGFQENCRMTVQKYLLDTRQKTAKVLQSKNSFLESNFIRLRPHK